MFSIFFFFQSSLFSDQDWPVICFLIEIVILLKMFGWSVQHCSCVRLNCKQSFRCSTVYCMKKCNSIKFQILYATVVKQGCSMTLIKEHCLIVQPCAAPRCPATLPLILNGSEGHHHFWHRRDPAPRLQSDSGKERSNLRGQLFIQ